MLNLLKEVVISEKIRLGKFYTIQNIFNYPHFRKWFNKALQESNNLVLEPFAGSNNLIKMLQIKGYNFNFVSYDINPSSPEVKKRNTIKDFPKGYKLTITNPPYLAKNSAHRKKITGEWGKYDNLYKLCLEKMLFHCQYVAAIVPASFINSDLFLDRLNSYTLLSSQMFTDTETPTCLVLFSPQKSDFIYLYEKDRYVGELYSLKKELTKILTNSASKSMEIRFNDKNGNIGLCAIDNTRAPSIAFIPSWLVPEKRIKISSRHLTRISVKEEVNLDLLNEIISSNQRIYWWFSFNSFSWSQKRW